MMQSETFKIIVIVAAMVELCARLVQNILCSQSHLICTAAA